MRWFGRLAAALLLSACAVAAPARAEHHAERPTSITVLLDDTYPPYIFRDETGTLQGILKDRWELWSHKTGIAVRLEGMDWAEAQRRMKAGQADVIDTMFRTPERERLYRFSQPYASIDVPIFFHRDISGIAGAATLKGFTVGVKDGDACIDWLKSQGLNTLSLQASYDSLIDAAVRGDIKVFCIDKPPATYLMLKKGVDGLFRHSAPLYSGQFHWAVPRDDSGALYSLIRDGFESFTPDEIQAIEDRWMGRQVVAGITESPLLRYFLHLIVLAGALAAALLVWNGSLHRRVGVKTAQLTSTLEQLEASRRHLVTLVSATPVGVFEGRQGMAISYVNDRALEMIGLGREQAQELGWLEAVHPGDRDDLVAAWNRVLAHRMALRREWRFLAADGRVVWVLGQVVPHVRAESGESEIGFIGSITDITERREAERALGLSEARFRAIFDNVNDAIFIQDLTSGRIEQVNQRMRDMYGLDAFLDPRQLTVGDISEGTSPYSQAEAMNWIALAAAGEPQLFEWRARRTDGSLFWVEVGMRRAPIAAVGDHLLVVVRDISDRKEAEEKLRHTIDALTRSNTDLERFAYVASHDLREPLRSVVQYSQLLDRRYGPALDQDGRDFLGYLVQGAKRMMTLVEGLLEYSRVDSKGQFHRPVDMNGVLSSVQENLKEAITQSGARLGSLPLPTIIADEVQMVQLLQNLIGNAIKFRHPDRLPDIGVGGSDDGDAWRFWVDDNGLGIDPAYAEQIFVIFKRLHTQQAIPGGGIGLAVCKRIVERHGGRLWVEPRPEGGSRFLFTLSKDGRPDGSA